MVKNGPKTGFLNFLRKLSIILSETGVKQKFLWFINILQNRHAWEKFGSQIMAKKGSQPMRFQYLIINISLIDRDKHK